MAQYVGVSFRRQGNVYFFLASPFVLSVYDMVLVKTDEGIGFGEIVAVRENLPEGFESETIKPIYRPANQEDVEIGRENAEVAREARVFCQQCVARMGLDMKLVDVEIYFDKSKIIFYFTAPGRVDFRDLVKDLVRTYRTRIELRQIGVRHETQMIGALGNCGQMCCCRRYLRRFEPVTIKMAKDQNLFLNPAKISGVCGRLLCCLAYEKDNYADFQRRAPKLGRKFHTTMGVMRTLRANMFRETVTVMNEQGEEVDFPLIEWNALVLRDDGRGHERDDAPDEVPAELQALMDVDADKHQRGERQPFTPGRRDQRSRQEPQRSAPSAPRQSLERPARPPRNERPDNSKSCVSDKGGTVVESESSAAPLAGRERKEPRYKDKRRKSGHQRKEHGSTAAKPPVTPTT